MNKGQESQQQSLISLTVSKTRNVCQIALGLATVHCWKKKKPA